MELATIDDAPAILALQRVAYAAVAERYGEPNLPPLTETLQDIEDQLALQTVLKVCRDGAIVGSVRAFQRGGTCYVGRLIVAPELQGQGIGTALLLSIESHFPEAGAYELFTGHRCTASQDLYAHLGYREVRRERISERVTHVILRKTMVPEGAA